VSFRALAEGHDAPWRLRLLGGPCERFAAPVIDTIICQDIKTEHMQKIVNAPSTPGEGGRVRGMISALVTYWRAAVNLVPRSRIR
jgi:hypothetical protein